MDSVAVTVPLRKPTKKMKKRKELDALAPPHAVSRRSSGKRSSQELLTDSSDERSEYWNISTRSGRKCRGRRSRACPGFLKACSAFLACASVIATASLIWLFIDVRQQLTALRTELDQVMAGSEGVPEALQKCHSLSRDLQNNQTIIFSHISDLKLQINNFTMQLAGIQRGLHQVQEWFKTAPELVNVPKDLKALSTSILSFGSQIQDLGVTVETLKKNNVKIQDSETTMQQNISNIKHSVQELYNITQKPQLLITNETKIKTDELNATMSHLESNLMYINQTLSTSIQNVANDHEDSSKKITALQEKVQGVSMKVMSLQGECAKLSEQTVILASVQKLTDQVKQIRMEDTEIGERVNLLEKSYNTLRNSTNVMLAAIPEIQSQQEISKTKRKGGPFDVEVTTE